MQVFVNVIRMIYKKKSFSAYKSLRGVRAALKIFLYLVLFVCNYNNSCAYTTIILTDAYLPILL